MRIQRKFSRTGYDYGGHMRSRGRRTGALIGVVATALTLAACADSSSNAGPEPSPSTSISTLTALPMPDMGPPPGELVADLRQASRDSALGRFQVWIGNGLRRGINPTSIRYLDPRFRAAIPGERLRANPSDTERGYPLALPPRPRCDVDVPTNAAPGNVVIAFDGRQVRIPVEDEADVVARYVASRCLELAAAQVAHLSFADKVPADGSGEGSAGTLVLVARPTGRGGTLMIETVGGTPVLTAKGSTAWRPRVTVRGTGPVRRIELPVVPNRCDDHAFLESGGATAFIVHLRVGDESGDLILRMSQEGAANAIRFARDSCGLE
jgi:hypothetical protein